MLSVLLRKLDSVLVQFSEVQLSRKDVTRREKGVLPSLPVLIVFPFSPPHA